MFISHLFLTNFRNYKSLDMGLSEGPVMLVGDNAQGKTNLLEAICVLSTSRSPWAGSDREYISWNVPKDEEALCRIRGEIQRGSVNIALEVFILGQRASSSEDETSINTVQKRLRINGAPRSASGFIGHLAAVTFAPQDLSILSGGPAMRRRYIDMALSQVEPGYARAFQKYNRVLLQRNHLLRRILEGHSSPGELEFWDDSLAESGSEILTFRVRAVERIAPLSVEVHSALTGGVETLSPVYSATIAPNGELSPNVSREEMKELFLNRLMRVRGREIGQGQTVVGPHRDDVKICVDGRAADTYASRGQQRTAALALKLAEARFIEESLGEQPVLLLDDVFSELDGSRRGYLLETAAKYQQVFITTTDADRMEGPLSSLAAKFWVKGGTIAPLC